MGLDFGTKRIGIALSNSDQTIASPFETYALRTPALDADYLRQTAEDYRVKGLVVGLPVHMSGDEGTKARQAREFGEWAAEATSLPVRFWDERYTSAQAEVYLMQTTLSARQRKARLDMLAAQVMLQSYLDAPDRTAAPGRRRE